MHYRRLPKWFGLAAVVAVAIALLGSVPSGRAAPVTPRHYSDLEFPELPEVRVPDYTRFTLDNGMVVYLMEDRDLPLVSGTALLRAASRYEPTEQVGLGALTGTTMRLGGTATRAPEAVDAFLEERAAAVEVGVGRDAGSASFQSLSENLTEVFALFAEVLREPAFAEEAVELAKQQQRSAIARRNDDPNRLASRELQKLIYGADSPYARQPEYETLANITREDLRAFHRTHIRPEGIVLGLVGDFDTAAMRDRVEATFGDWRAREPLPDWSAPPVEPLRSEGLFVIDQPQLSQSSVRFGHVGGRFDDPDYPAMRVVSEVLNGFGGRLFDEIRSRRGLAYSVFSGWQVDFDREGFLTVGAQTQSAQTVPLIEAAQAEIERMRAEPISEQELSEAREATVNSMVFNFRTPAQSLSRLLRYELHGYPEDFLFQVQAAIANLTAEDVLAAAQENLQDSFATVVVGNVEAIQPPLSNLGETVTALDVSIPEPSI